MPRLSLRRRLLYPFNYENKCRIFGLFNFFGSGCHVYESNHLRDELLLLLYIDFSLFANSKILLLLTKWSALSCPLRRAPTNCHSLSIWGKVNPYGTLLKTISDSIWVILNIPSVKLWKLADCLLQLIIGECLDITIDICYMTTMLRTFDHGKQYSIKLPIESTRYFLVYK